MDEKPSDTTSLNKGKPPSNKDQLLYVCSILALTLSICAITIVLIQMNSEKAQINAILDTQQTHEQVIQRLAGAIYNQTQINYQQGQFNLDVVNFAKNVTATIRK